MRKIKELYYRFKYRPKKGTDGATAIGVIYKSKKRKSDLDSYIEKISDTVTPCYKRNEEVLKYIESKYTLRTAEISDKHLEMLKVNYILSVCPEILKTPVPDALTNGKMPSRKEFLSINENERKRFEEAKNYPAEKLNLNFKNYIFECPLTDECMAEFNMITEENSDTIISFSANTDKTLTKAEQQQINYLIADISVYKGITKEDIEKKTNRFKGYALDLMCIEKGGAL